jgi:uncharacterized delta-60 repeat protein
MNTSFSFGRLVAQSQKACLLLVLLSVAQQLPAQQLQVDASIPGAIGFNNTVFAVIAQPDDKILMGGSFVSYNGQSASRIIRLRPNGQADSSFVTGSGFDGRVNKMVRAADGKIYVGGLFDVYNNHASKNIVRLHADGRFDSSFQTGIGLNNEVLAMEVLPDGSVICSGFFNSYNFRNVTRPIRILANGELDTNFNAGGAGAFSVIDVIRRQPDGKLLLGGSFSTYNGQPTARLVRILADGSIDTAFQVGAGFAGGHVRDIQLQPDGKILVAGGFSSYRGVSVPKIVRLLPDGNLDHDFLLSLAYSGSPLVLVLRPNGHILAFGQYTPLIAGQYPRHIALFDASGNMLNLPGDCASSNGGVNGAAELSDGTVWVGGNFSMLGAVNRQRLARILHATGPVAGGTPQLSALSQATCPGDTVVLQASGLLHGGAQWHWYSGGCGQLYAGSGTQLVVNPTQTTTYYVQAQDSCTAAGPCDSIVVQVLDTLPPVPTQAHLPLLVLKCGESAMPPLAIDNCDGLVTASSQDSLRFNEPGNYQINWTYTDAAGNSHLQLQQVLVDTIDTRVIVSAVSLEAHFNNADAYQWLDCQQGLQAVVGATQFRFMVNNPGQWAVAIGSGSCTDTSACFSNIGAGLPNAAFQGLRLYPNPAGQNVFIEFDEPLELQLFDLHGRLVFVSRSHAGQQLLTLPALAAGTYFWHINSGKASMRLRQLIHE